MKKAMVTIEKYRRKRLPSFANKSLAEAYAELSCDIWGLVWKNCSIEFNSWKMVFVDAKNSIVQQLSISLYYRMCNCFCLKKIVCDI